MILKEFHQSWTTDLIYGNGDVFFKEDATTAVIDLSEPNKYKHLRLIYDSAIDSLQIEYKKQNDIVNDLEVRVELSPDELDSKIVARLKELALSKVY